MKKLFLFFVLIPLVGTGQHCNSPMPANVFKQKMSQLVLQNNDQQRLIYATNMLTNSCFLSAQIRDAAIAFTNDYYRYEFARKAWSHTFDPGNFFDVYNAFSSFSGALRLYDYVSSINYAQPAQVSWFPDIPYPDITNYSGVTGCQAPVSDKDFDEISKLFTIQHSDAERKAEGLKIVKSNCISFGQAMKLSTVFQLESNRLLFLKEIFPKIYDLENYTAATVVFDHIPYKNEWLSFGTAIIDSANAIPVCEVKAEEFSEIKNNIKDVSVNSTRVNLAKQILSTKKCFSTSQVKQIVELFSVESSRLEIALYAYDFCSDKENYYQLQGALSTTGSKNRLIEFINSKK